MNLYEFIASVINSVTWLLTLITLVLIFQKPIRNTLSKILKFKYKDVEFELQNDLEQLKKAIEEESSISKDQISKKDSFAILQDSESLANIFPEASITSVWTIIESEIMSTVMRLKCSPDYPPRNSVLTNMDLLVRWTNILNML